MQTGCLATEGTAGVSQRMSSMNFTKSENDDYLHFYHYLLWLIELTGSSYFKK